MTNLRQLLAFTMKEKRRILGYSQAKLAEKADLSTQYIAMIELGRKFPGPETLERIAEALELDVPELFSMPPTEKGLLKKIGRKLLADIEKEAGKAVNKAVREAVGQVIADHIRDMERLSDIRKKL